MNKKTVFIEDIADALEAVMDEWEQYLNIETGEIVSMPSADDNLDREDEDVLLAEEIEYSGKYVRLPNQYDIHAYHIMENFAYAASDQNHQEKLIHALHGRKPYRNFKEEINYLGMADMYYAYRLFAFYKIALKWCERNKIPFDTKRNDLKMLLVEDDD